MSDNVSYEDRMSEADALMWHIERDPLLRSTVTSVWVLDCAPDDERFDDTLAHAVDAFPDETIQHTLQRRADEQLEPLAVKAERDQDIERESAQQHIDQGADEGTDRPFEPADHRYDQDVDHRPNARGAGRDLAVEPGQQDAGIRRRPLPPPAR